MRISFAFAVLAVLFLEAGATLALHISPDHRTQLHPTLAFSASPLLNFLSVRPHASRPSNAFSSSLHPRWICNDPLRAGRASGLVCKLRQKLTDTEQADLGLAVEQAAASTRGVSPTAQTIIEAKSPLGTALGDLGTTAYFFEMGFLALSPGSTLRFLATLRVNGCITVFASGPGGRAFGAHINVALVVSSLRESRDAGRWGEPLEKVSEAMQEVFADVDPSRVTISLVGGWRAMDGYMLEELQFHFPEEEAIRSFSGVVRKWVDEALSGAAIDVSLLNRFEGYDYGPNSPDSGEEELRCKLKCWLEGQFFGVVALDSHTGMVVSQTKYFPDRVQNQIGPVPRSVLDEADRARQNMNWNLESMPAFRMIRKQAAV
jgi:hypothetical protein